MIRSKIIKAGILLGAAVSCFYAGAVFAVSGVGIGVVAANALANFKPVAQLITAGAYIAGFGFGVGAVVKFKAHKDNPTQVPLSQPIALLFVAAALMFIPSVFSSVGKTLYGASGTAGGVSGTQCIPGVKMPGCSST
jgi:intracellular multiplication protein IcmD